MEIAGSERLLMLYAYAFIYANKKIKDKFLRKQQRNFAIKIQLVALKNKASVIYAWDLGLDEVL